MYGTPPWSGDCHSSWSVAATYEPGNEDLYNVRLATCDGGSYAKVKTVQEGSCILADCLAHTCFTSIRGQGARPIAQQFMMPVAPTQDWQVAEALDKWRGNRRTLECIG